MAAADYYLCDVCLDKAFYDADIQDPRYIASWNARYGVRSGEDVDPIAIKALCSECKKKYDIIVVAKQEK